MVLLTSVALPVAVGNRLGRAVRGGLLELVNSGRRLALRCYWCLGHLNRVLLLLFFNPLPDPWPVGVDHQRLQDGKKPPDEEVEP